MPGYHLPYFTAAATRIYARHGLEVEIVDPFPGPDNIRAVAAGRYDFCLTSVAHFLRAKRDDHELRAKFVFMVARRTHMAAFCLERGAIETFADLEGASFLGPPDSPFAREYRSLLRHLGLEPGPTVDLPYEEVFGALAAGRGDVAADFLDLLPRFEALARVHALPFYEAGLDLYGSGLVAGTRTIESRPEAVRRLVAAIREALRATRRDPAAGLPAMRSRFPELDEGRALAGWQAGTPLIFTESDRSLGAMDTATWERTIEHHAATHGSPPLPPTSVFDASFLLPDVGASAASGPASRATNRALGG